MKITEILLEAPYVHAGQYSTHGNADGTTVSSNTLQRTYSLLGSIEVDEQLVELHLLTEAPRVIGTVPVMRDGEERHLVVFSIRFKDKPIAVPGADKVVQVDSAWAARDFRHFGIAQFAYARLVAKGFAVVSDSSQFEDGKMLWKKMAKKAQLQDYQVFILDVDYGFKQKDGQPLVYDGSNIDDAEIWTAGDDFAGYNVLLVAK